MLATVAAESFRCIDFRLSLEVRGFRYRKKNSQSQLETVTTAKITMLNFISLHFKHGNHRLKLEWTDGLILFDSIQDFFKKSEG